jgi:molybdopterin-guanine dinucleotide biosynthesis protein A
VADHSIPREDITGVVLAGGRGSRMGGVDKGLQPFRGEPLALTTVRRLAPQVERVMINANRNIADYEAFGVPVWPDGLADYAGPLAGMLAALDHCTTPWLVTVPCDTPLFPMDLVARLASAAQAQDAEIAMAAAREDANGPVRTQPVFCLLRTKLHASLAQFTHTGGRKIDAWTAQHRTVVVPFDAPADDPRAFVNANTLAELQRLEQPD